MRLKSAIPLVALSTCGLLNAVGQGGVGDPLTPLMKASARGDLKAVKRLLSSGADPRQRTRDGETALYEAIEWRHPNESNLPVVETLLKAGADPNEIEIFGTSALVSSLTRDHVNPGVTLMLLRSGARANTSCSKRDSLVSLATQDSSQEVISALIAEGAPVNCQDEHGQTALDWAAINGQADRVALLLKNGADGTLKNSEGKTPRDVASTTNFDKHVQEAFASTRAELIAATTSPSSRY